MVIELPGQEDKELIKKLMVEKKERVNEIILASVVERLKNMGFPLHGTIISY